MLKKLFIASLICLSGLFSSSAAPTLGGPTLSAVSGTNSSSGGSGVDTNTVIDIINSLASTNTVDVSVLHYKSTDYVDAVVRDTNQNIFSVTASTNMYRVSAVNHFREVPLGQFNDNDIIVYAQWTGMDGVRRTNLISAVGASVPDTSFPPDESATFNDYFSQGNFLFPVQNGSSFVVNKRYVTTSANNYRGTNYLAVEVFEAKPITAVGGGGVSAAEVPAIMATNLSIFQRTLYVSASGNDSSAIAGNPLKPWATISNAINAAVAGDTVVISGTNYGGVLIKNGVVLDYLPGSYHYVSGGGIFYDTSVATNVLITGCANLFKTNSSDSVTIFYSSGSNSTLNVTAEFNSLGSGISGSADDRLFFGSFANATIRANSFGLMTPQAGNTNRNAELRVFGPAQFSWHDQHSDWVANQKFYDVTLNGSAPEASHTFGDVKLFGGEYTDDASPLGMHGGSITLLGTRVYGFASLLDAQNWDDYPATTNVLGYYFRDGELVAENSIKIRNQGAPATASFSSRNGSASTDTQTISLDGTNNVFVFSAPLLGNGGSLTNLNTVYSVESAGTAATLGTATTALNFGTTRPSLVISNAGRYMICAQVDVSRSAGSTMDEIGNGISFTASINYVTGTPIRAASTSLGWSNGSDMAFFNFSDGVSVACLVIEPNFTATNNTAIRLQGLLSEDPSSGTITASKATLTAIKLAP